MGVATGAAAGAVELTAGDDDALPEEGRSHPGADLPADIELHAGKRPRDQAQREDVDLDALDAHDGGLVKHHLPEPVLGNGAIAPVNAPLRSVGVFA